MEVLGKGNYQADGRGHVGDGSQGRQEGFPESAQVVVGDLGKSNPAVFRQFEVVQAAGAQGNQDKVDDGDAGKTDGTSLGQGQGSFLAFLDLEALDGRNNHNPEGQSCQGVQGVVALQEAVGQRSSEVVGASLRAAG